MDNMYLIILMVLFILAILDVIVGVGNDAVNFVSSAIGARVAPFFVIMTIASGGVLLGAITSNGMMEIARSGIFVPSMFTFHNIMIIFVGVMITDILLLNAFNAAGLPTSTTVSIIFELMGGGISMALISLYESGQSMSLVLNYINTATALKIISGIFISIIFAFLFGAIIQWIVRLIFSFNYEEKVKKYGAFIGGVALTVITYFIVIKGMKSTAFMPKELLVYIHENTSIVLLGSFVFWTVFSQILYWVFKTNVLKIVVLAGTFGLALAFAGNDLVNFIGVPLAALESAQIFQGTAGANTSMTMGALSKAIQTPTLYLLIAGIIMVLTLWFSKHARNVTQTTLNLSNQGGGQEQFGSSLFARVLVRNAIRFSDRLQSVLPNSFNSFVSKRFTSSTAPVKTESFDLMRASVNLMVASLLISLGTSFKLPLSTTYVTFMVAMATSLADGAWGRETAVYRITGVFTVITGWFLTAFIAFTLCAIVVWISYIGELFAILPLFGIALYFLYKSVFKKSKNKNDDSSYDVIIDADENSLVGKSLGNSKMVFSNVLKSFSQICEGCSKYDRHVLKKAKEHSKELDIQIKNIKDNINYSIRNIDEKNIDSSHHYVQVIDYLREVSRSLGFITEPIFKHVNNNHKPLIDAQKEELSEIYSQFESFIAKGIDIMEHKKFDEMEDYALIQTEMFAFINKLRKVQIKRVKEGEVNTRNSLLYLQMLHEFKQILSFSMNVVKSHRDMIVAQ